MADCIISMVTSLSNFSALLMEDQCYRLTYKPYVKVEEHNTLYTILVSSNIEKNTTQHFKYYTHLWENAPNRGFIGLSYRQHLSIRHGKRNTFEINQMFPGPLERVSKRDGTIIVTTRHTRIRHQPSLGRTDQGRAACIYDPFRMVGRLCEVNRDLRYLR